MSTLDSILGLILTVSSVLGVFTALVNKLFSVKLDPIEKRIDRIDEMTLRNDMQIWRFQVTRFSSEVRRGIPKTKFEYESIFTLITDYEMAVERLGIANGFFTSEVDYIKEQYNKLKD